MLKVKKANPATPARVLIYGPEGTGKSTFGAKMPNPVFITPEGGADRLKRKDGEAVDILEGSKWDDVLGSIKALQTEDHAFKSLVIDSCDWLEQLAHQKIIGTSGKTIITVAGGYGSGYRQSQNLHKDLIDQLERLRLSKGMNIVVTGHSHVKAVKDPDASHDYDAHEIKCHEYVSSLWREYVDALLFVRFRTYVREGDEGKKARAFGDAEKRVVYSVKQPAFQAKNRFGMPAEEDFDLDYTSRFEGYVARGQVEERAADIHKELVELIGQVKDEATQTLMYDTVTKAGDDVDKLKPIRERVRKVANG